MPLSPYPNKQHPSLRPPTFDALACERLGGPRLVASPKDRHLARARGAIVCLAKGHSNAQRYDRLMARNQSIYETINRHRERQYPLIIWHEGNISAEHQRYIQAGSLNADVRFADISSAFQLPGSVAGELVEHWPVGYRLMCRFHTYHIWQYCRQFDYVMRIDDDCTLRSARVDPIQWLHAVGADFAAATFVSETHGLTNRSLPVFVKKYLDMIHRPAAEIYFYNQVFPYTNLYVTRTAFWLEAEIQRFLYAIIREPDSIRLRWGDLPVLGVALNIFAAPEKVASIPDLVYRHASHNCTVVSDGG
jgi:hypothetical protein